MVGGGNAFCSTSTDEDPIDHRRIGTCSITAACAVLAMKSIGTELAEITEEDMPLTVSDGSYGVRSSPNRFVEKALRYGESMETYPEDRALFEKSLGNIQTETETMNALFEGIDQKISSAIQHAEEAGRLDSAGEYETLRDEVAEARITLDAFSAKFAEAVAAIQAFDLSKAHKVGAEAEEMAELANGQLEAAMFIEGFTDNLFTRCLSTRPVLWSSLQV